MSDGERPGLGIWPLLRSELALIAGRRRNQAGLVVLAAVPVVLAFAVKASAPRSGTGMTFLSLVTSNGLFVPLAALAVESAMMLPLAVAMLCGDAIAGEANQGTLRYLLTVPVGRPRLLVVKFLSLVIGAFWGVAVVVLSGAVAGVALFGTGPMTTLSGSQLGLADALGRVALVALYLGAELTALAAVGLFFSTLTEQPLAATIALMGVNVLSWILGEIDAVSWLHPVLIVRDVPAFADFIRDPILTDTVWRGLGLWAAYVVVFTSLAWARFAGKDITS